MHPLLISTSFSSVRDRTFSLATKVRVDIDFTHVVHNDRNLEVLFVVKNVVQQRGLARPEKAGEHRDRKFVVNLHGWCMLGCHIGKISCCRSASQSRPRQLCISAQEETMRVQRPLPTLNMSTHPTLPKGCARPIFSNLFASSGTRRSQKRPRKTKSTARHQVGAPLQQALEQA